MKTADTNRRRFLFREALGRGGFGEVYLAEMQAPSGLRATVAVKVLHGGLDPASQAVRRLTDEGKILSLLNHPGIVGVYDLAILEGRVALVTEFVEGADLPDCLVGPDPMPRGAVYEAFAVVADALHAAHVAKDADGKPLGLLHRDVKPRNIRVGKHGQVKLLDFGIATASGLAREAQTGTSALIGSFPYMAPERFRRSDSIGPPSDIYSLGCALYEALVGEVLFPQEDIARLLLPKTSPQDNAEFLRQRFASLEERAPEAVDLVRTMVHLEPSERPIGPDLVAALEDLSAEMGGIRLKRWARDHDWGEIRGEKGPLTGREIVEAGEEGAGVAGTVGATMHDTLEDTPTTTTLMVQGGIGLAALLAMGAAFFLLVVVITAGVAWFVMEPDGDGAEGAAVVDVGGVSGEDAAGTEDGSAEEASSESTDAQGAEGTEDDPEKPDGAEVADGTGAGADGGSGSDGSASGHRDGSAASTVVSEVGARAPSGRGVDRCGDLLAMEPAAAAGRLSISQRRCLSAAMRASSLRQVEKARLGRLVLADAQARCKAGKGCADYEREQPWYFEEVEQSDPDMMLAWASHQFRRGRFQDTRTWVRRALSRKQQWTGATRIKRVDALLRLDAMAAHELWKAAPRNDDLRHRAKEAAADWANHRARTNRDPGPAMELCISAAGSAEACNARVHDRAATAEVVIASKPAGMTVIVDGEARGTTPTPVKLSFGAHEITLRSGESSSTRTIQVGVGTPRQWSWSAKEDRWTSAY